MKLLSPSARWSIRLSSYITADLYLSAADPITGWPLRAWSKARSDLGQGVVLSMSGGDSPVGQTTPLQVKEVVASFERRPEVIQTPDLQVRSGCQPVEPGIQ